ncbi:MAG: TonB-dependent receptor [Pyrinomonadaceae bacterium]|nr:TonB-dependent receptor [Pyrinomonadaceae bacterium]
MLKKSILTPLFSFLCVLTFVFVTFGQGTTSRITGVVTDSNGAIVAGATITLTNEGTKISLTTVSSESGTYTFDLLQVGTYQVTIEKQGFKKFISRGNSININQPATVNAVMQVGDVSAEINVQATVEQVQTSTSGNLGSTIDQKTLESIPIVGVRGRNPLDLLNFQPGVVFGGNTGGAVNVHGSRDRAFNFTLDGIDINESTAGGSNFTPLRPNPDSVQEFQIVTSNFTAELGRSSGANVTLVTKSGTNEFHGNLFEFYQTPRFNAKSYAGTLAKTPKEQFVQHIFGGSLGGPLWNPGFGEGTKMGWLRNKAFFFTNLQFLRAYDTALVQRTVYTPSARAGLFRYVVGRANAPAGTSTAAVDSAGNTILPACTGTPPTNSPCISSFNIAGISPAVINSAVLIDPTLQGYINAMPLPNDFTGGDGLNTALFDFASPQHEKQYDFVSKFDFKLNDNNVFYVRYAQGSQSSLGDSGNGGRPIFPNSPNFVDTSRTPKNLAANWRWSPTSAIANEFIFGVSTYFFTFATPTPDPNLPFAFINPATPNTNFSYNARGVRTMQYIDNLTYVNGNHTFKGGLNFRFNRHKDDRSSVAGAAIEPTVTFSGVAGFTGFGLPTAGSTSINSTDLTRLQNTINDLLGRVGNISQAFVSDPTGTASFAPAGTRWLNIAHYPELDFYFQDNWRYKQNLTFDLGLRWEAKLTPSIEGRQLLVPNQPVKLGATPTNSIQWVPGKLFKNDYSKFLPSIGFAWDPFKSGKTSIRANYRIASDRIATFLFGSSIFQSTPGNNIGVTNSSYGQGGGLYRNLGAVYPTIVPSSTPTALRQPPAFSTNSISVIDPDLQFPQIHEWSASFQREIGKGNVVEVNYIGKHGVHLLGGYNVNQANIFASVAGINENFVQAFNSMRADTAYNSPLINFLMTGSAANNNGTARFRALNTTALANTGTAGGSVASAAIVLSQKLCVAADQTAGIPCTLGARLLDQTGNGALIQPFSQFTGGINVFDSNDYSHYNGLEVIFKRRISNGLGFQVGYTLSKSMDNRSWDPSLSTVSTGSAQSASSTPFDLRNRNINYSWSDFDRRHVLQATYVYELPFGKGKMLNTDNKVLDYIVSGWQLSGTFVYMQGRPFTVYSGLNTLSSVVQSTANCNGCSRTLGKSVLEGGLNFWFDATARALFSQPKPGELGNTPRNYFLEPNYFQTDASLSKKFKLTEKINFDFRVEARNLTNTVDLAAPTAVFTSSIFGRINNSVNNSARRIQWVGKVNF